MESNQEDKTPSPADPTVDEVIERLDHFWSNSEQPAAGHFRRLDGHRIGHFLIENMVGSGGFGVVYQARDERLNRRIALKIPRPEVLADAEKLTRFKKEAATAASLEHRYIVPVYEANLDSITPYIATAFCDGPSLLQWMVHNTLPVDQHQATTLIAQLAEAVQHAHQRGVVHRDLKPGNIMLVPLDDADQIRTLNQFQPKLTDFGLAKISQEILHDTRSSVMLGSPLYMAPEQAQCEKDQIGPAADIFGLGAILYHLLSGSPPFAAESYPAVLRRLREESPAPLTKPGLNVDRDLETICLKCLEKSPEDRFGSADELGCELNRFIDDEPIHSTRKNAAQKIWRWSFARDRVREAMFAVILISVVRTVFAFFGLWMVKTSETAATHAELIDSFAAHLFVTTPSELFIMIAALWNGRHRLPRSLYLAILFFLTFWAVATLSIALNLLPNPAWFRRMPGARVTAFSLISTLFAAQTICWYIGDWSRNKSRRSGSDYQYTIKMAVVGAPVLLLFCAVGYGQLSTLEEPVLSGPASFVELDGVNDFVSIESVPFDRNSSITLEAWVHSHDSRKSVAVQYGPVSLGMAAAPNGNRFQVTVHESETELYELNAETIFANKQWVHLAVVYNGNSNAIDLYLNGDDEPFSVRKTTDGENFRDAELPEPVLLTNFWPSSKTIIGAADENANAPFGGKIGEVRLTQAVFYHAQFTPEERFSTSNNTMFLFHLNNTDSEFTNATGNFKGRLHR